MRLCVMLYIPLVPMYSKCTECRNLVQYHDISNKRNLHKAPSKLICKFCYKQCHLCIQSYSKTKNFTVSSSFCDKCAVLRKASLENVYFRYPQLRHTRNDAQYSPIKNLLSNEMKSRENVRISKGFMADQEIRRRYYHRHRHRPV